jgi:hypothetical protein
MLDDRQIMFCELYITYGNATKAAKQSGYSENNPGQVGHELLKNPEIKQYLKDRHEALRKNHGVDRDMMINELKKLMTFNVKELFNDDDTQKAMSDITVDAAAAITTVKFGQGKDTSGNNVLIIEEYKTANKIDAISALAKMLGVAGPEDPSKNKQLLTIDEIEIIDHNPDANEKPVYDEPKPITDGNAD